MRNPKIEITDTDTSNIIKTNHGTVIETGATNVMIDGDFTGGIQHPYLNVSNGTIEIINDVATGKKILKHVNTGGGESVTNSGSVHALSPAASGQTWTASIWVRTEEVSTNVAMFTMEIGRASCRERV